MNLNLVVFLGLAWVCLGQTEPGGARAAVNIKVYTTFGEPLEQAQVLVRGATDSPQYKRIGPDTRIDGLAFGLYSVEVQAIGFITSKLTVGIYQPESSYRIGLAVAPPHSGERSEVSGSVTPVPANPKDVWVRLVGVFGSDLIEDQLDHAGNFRMVGMAPGRYALLVFDKGHLAESKEIQFMGGKLSLSIALPR